MDDVDPAPLQLSDRGVVRPGIGNYRHDFGQADHTVRGHGALTCLMVTKEAKRAAFVPVLGTARNPRGPKQHLLAASTLQLVTNHTQQVFALGHIIVGLNAQRGPAVDDAQDPASRFGLGHYD